MKIIVRHRLQYILTVMLLSVFPLSVDAQKTIDLGQLIELGLDLNPDIGFHSQSLIKAKALTRSAGKWPDPILSYEWANLPVDSYSFGKTPMSGKKLSLSQPIPFPGKVTGLKRVRALQAKKQKHQYDSKKLEIIFLIKKGYYELFYAIAAKRVVKEQKKLIKQLISSARSQYALGKIPQTEVINFQMEETDLITKLLAAERDINIAKSLLTRLVGADLNEYDLNKVNITKTNMNFKVLDLKLLTRQVLEANHLVKVYELGAESSVEKVRLAKLEFLPDFKVKAAYTMREENPIDKGVDFASLTVSINLPIWFTSKKSDMLQVAQAEHFASSYLLQSAQAKLTNEVQTIFLKLEESYNTINLFEDSLLPLVKQAVRTGKSAYLGGKVDYSTLLGSIRKRFDTELKSYKALVRYETLMGRIEFLLGQAIVSLPQ